MYGCFVGSMMKLFGSSGQPSRKIDHDGRRQHLHWTLCRSDARIEVESRHEYVLELAPTPVMVILSPWTSILSFTFTWYYTGHEIVFSHLHGIKLWDHGKDAKVICSNGILIFWFTWHVKFFENNKKEFIHFLVVFVANMLVCTSESLTTGTREGLSPSCNGWIAGDSEDRRRLSLLHEWELKWLGAVRAREGHFACEDSGPLFSSFLHLGKEEKNWSGSIQIRCTFMNTVGPFIIKYLPKSVA